MHMIDTREGKLYLADGTVCRPPERLLREPSPDLLAKAIERWARRFRVRRSCNALHFRVLWRTSERKRGEAMSTIWFWASIAILVLTLLGSLPGVRELFRPLMDMTARAIVETAKFLGGYLLWVGKTILHAHIDLVRHLMHPRRYFDPSEEIERDR